MSNYLECVLEGICVCIMNFMGISGMVKFCDRNIHSTVTL